MPLVLAPRCEPHGPLTVELGGVLPERLAGLTADAIARLPIRADGATIPVGDLFTVAGDAGDGVIECRGDFSRVHHVAAGMTGGRIVVRGDVGRHAGERMAGGTLEVAGDAGDWLAAGMGGGTVRVHGAAGDNLAGALPGETAGMRGGLVIVAGGAGHLAAARMLRGAVAIGGACGSAAGFEMHRGFVVLAGNVGPHPGLGMRRGAIVALGDPPTPPATFARGAAWSPPHLPLLLRRLGRAGFSPAGSVGTARWRQWHGDLADAGRGELWHPA